MSKYDNDGKILRIGPLKGYANGNAYPSDLKQSADISEVSAPPMGKTRWGKNRYVKKRSLHRFEPLKHLDVSAKNRKVAPGKRQQVFEFYRVDIQQTDSTNPSGEEDHYIVYYCDMGKFEFAVYQVVNGTPGITWCAKFIDKRSSRKDVRLVAVARSAKKALANLFSWSGWFKSDSGYQWSLYDLYGHENVLWFGIGKPPKTVIADNAIHNRLSKPKAIQGNWFTHSKAVNPLYASPNSKAAIEKEFHEVNPRKTLTRKERARLLESKREYAEFYTELQQDTSERPKFGSDANAQRGHGFQYTQEYSGSRHEIKYDENNVAIAPYDRNGRKNPKYWQE